MTKSTPDPNPETLPPEVVSELGYYVYALLDPTTPTPEVFYVGKGTGLRAFAHQHGAPGAVDDDSPNERRAKNARIQRIQRAGSRVQHLFLRTGMDNSTAFAVEQAVIDALRVAGMSLTNLVAGHGSSVADVDELLARYSHPCPPLPTGTVLIKIPRWHRGMTAKQVYDQTRQWWPIAERRVPEITTAFGLVDGVIRSAYTVDPKGWKDKWAVFGNVPEPTRRWSFKGEFTPDLEPYMLTHVRDVIDVTSQSTRQYPGW